MIASVFSWEREATFFSFYIACWIFQPRLVCSALWMLVQMLVEISFFMFCARFWKILMQKCKNFDKFSRVLDHRFCVDQNLEISPKKAHFHLIFAMFAPKSYEKHEKSIFLLRFGVPSAQTLVKIYNNLSYLCCHFCYFAKRKERKKKERKDRLR